MNNLELYKVFTEPDVSFVTVERLNEFQRPEFLITGEHNVSETGSITIFR
jgi:hypothetical protein